MIAVREILFPVNFSRECERMAPCVRWLAAAFGANLTLLHVVPRRTYLEEPDMVANLQSELVEFLPPGHHPGHLRYRVAPGDAPGDTIVDYANSQDTDLIAMPTRGHGLFRRTVIGSATETVLKRAECAVWTDARSGEPQSGIHRVLCVLRLNDDDVMTLRYAQEIATRLGAKLAVCHAVPESSESMLAHMVDRREVLGLEEAWRRVRELLRVNEITAEIIVSIGNGDTVLRRAAQRTRARLVIASRGEDPSAYDVVRAAPCPVLVRPTSRVIGARVFHAHDEEPQRLVHSVQTA